MPNQRQDDFFNVCSTCKDSCCKGARPPITNQRRRIIKEYLIVRGIKVENPFTEESYTFPREDALDGYCIFYDRKTGRCQVHPVKPETCVAGPVTFDVNKNTRKIEWYLKTEKICALAGRMFKDELVLQKHLESAKKEVVKLVSELEVKALQAILTREESDTFKIDEDDAGKDVVEKLKAN
jgi:Fe-S-cluster containining protein